MKALKCFLPNSYFNVSPLIGDIVRLVINMTRPVTKKTLVVRLLQGEAPRLGAGLKFCLYPLLFNAAYG